MKNPITNVSLFPGGMLSPYYYYKVTVIHEGPPVVFRTHDGDVVTSTLPYTIISFEGEKKG